ncbi:nicotianamine synthase-like [Diospyros lotus]|uniref:nicotianamine synthase-like n=1 Tax=Diospyros lotus TaxID=55363 RepID=UPI00225B87FF|nr:nicotianamine synthase-like [Diospyros lotus]
MACLEELDLIQKVCDLYDQISRLESLEPCKDVNMLFTQLVDTCISPSPPIDVTKLSKRVQEIRSELIRLSGQAEGLLERHFSTILGSFDYPLAHLTLFPYLSNYLKLSLTEFNILSQHSSHQLPTKLAFVGSGPLPLTSLVLARNHLNATTFHNYDVDPLANSLASRLVSSDPDLSSRMFFHTSNILDVQSELKDYQVVFLAALVGMDKEEKLRVIDHLAKYMAPGAILMLRSAHGARAFLYPVVNPCDLPGFEVLSIFHPTDDVINSVVIARKFPVATDDESSLDWGRGLGSLHMLPVPCKYCDEIHPFNPLNKLHMIDELAIEKHIS